MPVPIKPRFFPWMRYLACLLVFTPMLLLPKVYEYQEFFDLGLRNRLGIDSLQRLEASALRSAEMAKRPGSGRLTFIAFASGNLENGWMIHTAQGDASHDLAQWQTALCLSFTTGILQVSAGLMGNAFGLTIPVDLPTPSGDFYGGSGHYADSVSKIFLDDYVMVSLRFRKIPFLDWLQFSGSLAVNQVFGATLGGRELSLLSAPESVRLGGHLRAALGSMLGANFFLDPGEVRTASDSLLRSADASFLVSSLVYAIAAPRLLAAAGPFSWNPQTSDFIRGGLVWGSFGLTSFRPALLSSNSTADPLYALQLALPIRHVGIGAQASFYGAAWSPLQASAVLHDFRLSALYAPPAKGGAWGDAEFGVSWVYDRRLLSYGAPAAGVFGFDLSGKLYLGGRRLPVLGIEFSFHRNHPEDLWVLPDFHGVNRLNLKLFGVI